MIKSRIKTNFVMIMVINLLLIGSFRIFTNNIEVSEKDKDDSVSRRSYANSLKLQTPSPPTIKKSTLIGTGDNKSLILRSSNQSNVNLLLNQTNSTVTTETPTGWDVITTNLTVSNIQAYNQTINVENSPDSGSFSLSGNERVTSFEVISKCFLENISVGLYETSGTPSSVQLSLYNATWDGTRVKPNTAAYTFLLSESVDGINGWYTFSGLHILSLTQVYP